MLSALLSCLSFLVQISTWLPLLAGFSLRFLVFSGFLLQHSANILHMSHIVTKPTKWHVHPAQTQISLGIHWCPLMPRLIWVFAGRTSICWFCNVVAHIEIKIILLSLTHICLVDPSILINWTSQFPILGVSGVLFYSISNRYSC